MDFRILGSLEVDDDQGRRLALGAGRQRALLALLLLHASELVSSDRLIEEMWGEEAPATAARMLHNHVSQLRRVLGEGRLLTHGHGYILEIEPGSLDLGRFEALASEGARALESGDARLAAEKLRSALALWRGAPLADFGDEPFAQPAIARLEELRLAATEERAEAELRLGLHAELISELEKLVREHPLRERLRALHMLALYQSGRQAGALESYQAGRVALGELGLEPGDELRELQRSILRHDQRLASPVRAATAISPPVQPGPQTSLWRRRRRLLATLAAVALLAAAAAEATVALTAGSGGSGMVVAANSLAVIDPRSGHVVGQVPVGSRPDAVAVDRTGVWVASADDGTVSRINPTARRVVATIRTGAPASDIAVGEGSVWVASGSEGTLERIDPQTNTIVARLNLGGPNRLAPVNLCCVATGAGAVWAGSGAGDVLKIDPDTNKILTRVPVGLAPVDLSFGGGRLWAVHIGGQVLRIDPTTNRVTGTVPAAPYARAIAAGEGAVWVADAPREGGGLIWRIDPSTVKTSGGTTTLTDAPAGVATGGGAVWVVGGLSGTLIRINPHSGTVVRATQIGNVPLDVAYGDGDLWVTVRAQGTAPQ